MPPRPELIAQLESHFRRITHALYDTDVPAPEVDAQVRPWLDEQVSFVDPWQHGVGREKYRLGLAGFHTMLKFHLELAQLNITYEPTTRSGRAIVDGIMHLKLLEPLHVYPLRTILVFDFVVTDEGGDGREVKFLIRAHEEMWSFADMIAAVPGVGFLYRKVFRKAFAWGFLGASWLTARARGVLPR
ncbi:MAG: hypothetical protein Q8L48_40095 [Archangium sp.]|nr:hypothetical protein [Archangium sp.]